MSAPWVGEASCDLNKMSLRWTSQEPTEVATVSQFAAPRDGEASSDQNIASLRWTSEEPRKVATFRGSEPPGTARVHVI